ncbi:MAG: hypothetical protein A3F72_11970 [Bacteroidetes bacterium RIFCSPLOWO2_12_FULL_35_15]|nr:MAG: hypothetical protein A3F72_11970 [Bacteroidetes bacterium RIFCSPLOWO2_12_FULL_35_15]
MKKLFYIFLLFSSACFSQSKFKLITKIESDTNLFTSDNQGNIYLIKENELAKFDKTGKQLYKFSNKNFGNIDFVDASNMFKILVFYKNFSQVLFLDNTLSSTGDPVSIDKIGFEQAQLVCTSHNNGMWIYDQQNFELVRIDQNLEKTQQTGNLNVLLNINLQPVNLLEYDNKVYLNNPSTGILIFDIYGTYYKTIPIKNMEQFQVISDWIYFISERKAKAYNIKTTEEKEFEMPLTEFQNFRLEMGILMIQDKNSISIYSEE